MSAVEIKICGITRVEDALAAVELGTAMLGLNFYPPSPRCVSLLQAQEIARAVAGRARLAGVFVNMNVSEVQRIARAVPLNAVQLHGDEPQSDCEALAAEFAVIRAMKAGTNAGLQTQIGRNLGTRLSLLLDTPCVTYGGSGVTFHWSDVPWAALRAGFPLSKIFLAGGLHAANVAEAIAVAHPDAVDVCSGVESARGIKSVEKMREFVAAVRAAERQEQ